MITVGGAPLQEDQRVGVESRLNELVENAAVASFLFFCPIYLARANRTTRRRGRGGGEAAAGCLPEALQSVRLFLKILTNVISLDICEFFHCKAGVGGVTARRAEFRSETLLFTLH